jgi:hypothetical protein
VVGARHIRTIDEAGENRFPGSVEMRSALHRPTEEIEKVDAFLLRTSQNPQDRSRPLGDSYGTLAPRPVILAGPGSRRRVM